MIRRVYLRPAAAFASGFMTALLAVAALAGAGPAQAFWTDSASGSATLTAGTVPQPTGTGAGGTPVCTQPGFLGSQGFSLTWTAPAGVTPTGYRTTQTSSPAGAYGGSIALGTVDHPATFLSGGWGVTPGFLDSNTYSGTVTVATLLGTWVSLPRSYAWTLSFFGGVTTGSSCTLQ